MEGINEISDQGIAKSINLFLNRANTLFTEQKHMPYANTVVQLWVFFRFRGKYFHTKFDVKTSKILGLTDRRAP